MRQQAFIALISVVSILICQSRVSAQTFHTYHCRDGSEFVIAFFEGERVAHIQLDGKAIALPQRMSLRGFRYKKGDITLRLTKTVTTLKRSNRSTECTSS